MILESAIGARAKARAREDFNSTEKIPRRNYNEKKNSWSYWLYLNDLTNSARRQMCPLSHHFPLFIYIN